MLPYVAIAFHVSLGRFMYDHKPCLTLGKYARSPYDPSKYVTCIYGHRHMWLCVREHKSRVTLWLTLIQICEHVYTLTLVKLCVWIFKVHCLLLSRIQSSLFAIKAEVHCLLLSKVFKIHCLLLSRIQS